MEKKEKKKIVIRTIIKFLMIGLVTYIFIRCLMISGDTTVKEIDGDAITVVSGEEYHYAFDGVLEISRRCGRRLSPQRG